MRALTTLFVLLTSFSSSSLFTLGETEGGEATKGNTSAANDVVTVTVDNFPRAESHSYMAKYVKRDGFGKYTHDREFVPISDDEADGPSYGQPVIRMNRDTLYSSAVLNLTATNETILTQPEVESGRLMSTCFFSEDHDVFPCVYDAGNYTITEDGDTCGCGEAPCTSDDGRCMAIGTPLAFVLTRTLTDPSNQTDMQRAREIQDQMEIIQPGGAGEFNIPNWNQTDLTEIRDAILRLTSTTTTPVSEMFGFMRDLDRLSAWMGTASGWGGVRSEDQFYVFAYPPNNGDGPFELIMPADVPAELWSITVYNKEGFMFPPGPSNYNNVVGRSQDQIVRVQFGDCSDEKDEKAEEANSTSPDLNPCLPITPGWNTAIRFFRPEESLLDGSWQVPKIVEMTQ